MGERLTGTVGYQRTNPLAIAGFITAFVIPIAGLALGAIAIRQLRAPGNTEAGAGLARWALVVGSVIGLVHLAFFILWLALFEAALSNAPLGG